MDKKLQVLRWENEHIIYSNRINLYIHAYIYNRYVVIYYEWRGSIMVIIFLCQIVPPDSWSAWSVCFRQVYDEEYSTGVFATTDVTKAVPCNIMFMP